MSTHLDGIQPLLVHPPPPSWWPSGKNTHTQTQIHTINNLIGQNSIQTYFSEWRSVGGFRAWIRCVCERERERGGGGRGRGRRERLPWYFAMTMEWTSEKSEAAQANLIERSKASLAFHTTNTLHWAKHHTLIKRNIKLACWPRLPNGLIWRIYNNYYYYYKIGNNHFKHGIIHCWFFRRGK